MQIETATYFICPMCTTLHHRRNGAVKCCRKEWVWRKKWESVIPGDEIFVERNDGRPYTVTFNSSKCIMNRMFIDTTTEIDSGMRLSAPDLAEHTFKITPK